MRVHVWIAPQSSYQSIFLHLTQDAKHMQYHHHQYTCLKREVPKWQGKIPFKQTLKTKAN